MNNRKRAYCLRKHGHDWYKCTTLAGTRPFLPVTRIITALNWLR